MEGRPVIHLTDVPVFCNVLYDDELSARSTPTGDVELVECVECGLIYNRAFQSELVQYSPHYENSLHFSEAFQDYARHLARRLVQTYDLAGKRILEIGPGQGDFLQMMVDAGAAEGIGFDPSYDGDGLPGHPAVRVEASPFDATKAPDADLVVCRHVLEHLVDPRALLESLRAVSERVGATTYIEVPSADYMLREDAVFDVIYEHCSYFTAEALARLVQAVGMSVKASGTSFHGQYLYLEAGTGSSGEHVLPHDSTLIPAFATRMHELIDSWEGRIGETSGDVAVWGIGSKGVSYLNFVTAARTGARAVDISPRKWGRFVPGTGHRIESPEALVDQTPDLVVVMNPVYVREVRQRLRDLQVETEVVPV
jgi:SAM-dependent methyltransferase